MTSLLPHLRVHHVLATLVAIGIAAGCASGASKDELAPVSAPDAGPGQTHFVGVDGGIRDSGMVVEGGVNPRCGTANYCHRKTPDDTDACIDDDGGPPTGLPGRDSGPTRKDASLRDASAADAAIGAEGGVLDASKSAADGGAGDAADSGVMYQALPEPPPDAGPRLACQITRDDLGGPVHRCLPAGPGGDGEPCKSVSDCAPGFGCVGSLQSEQATGTGLCLKYCCEVGTMCAPGTYCADRPLLDGMNKAPLIVPVCAKGDPCGLLEPFPCNGDGCLCPQDTTCAVVRGDGTTGCVKPGAGKVGDTCPCAAGYYCSLATSTCVKMCKTDMIDTRCAPGKCQASAGLPAGFGLCVGYAPSKQ